MSDTDKTSVAALMSVVFRRKHNRTIDVKWLVKNEAYAREIIRISREEGPAELMEYANHFEELMFGKVSKPATPAPKPMPSKAATMGFEKTLPPNASLLAQQDSEPSEADISKYIGHLR